MELFRWKNLYNAPFNEAHLRVKEGSEFMRFMLRGVFGFKENSNSSEKGGSSGDDDDDS